MNTEKLFFKLRLRLRFFICVLSLLAWVNLQAQRKSRIPVKIHVDPKITLADISPDFIGFGYETAAVAQTNYFRAQNTKLIQLYRNLSPHGLIRIGGNVSDHTKYAADSTSIVHTEKEVTIINHKDLVNLAGFARATGWKVMWGLNLGTGSKEEAAEEAVAVDGALGNYLQSLQIGNEVDLQSNYNQKYDDYQSYFSDFLSYKAAICSALPKAEFSGPDVAGNLAWFRSFANTEAGKIKLLTYHYYRTGSHSPDATIQTLLRKDSAWNRKLKQFEKISQDNNVSFRINEVNSFYGGGKPGVSNTFASALWCLDYMFELASYGCNGVNMETDINQLGWISHYSPIVHDKAGNVSVLPEYYGMLAFAMAGKGKLLKLIKDNTDINISAYATKDNAEFLWITVINKDHSRDAMVEVALPQAYSHADAFRLKAPTVESKDHVSLAGAEVSADGNFVPGTPEKVKTKDNVASLPVPHASAVLIRLRHKRLFLSSALTTKPVHNVLK